MGRNILAVFLGYLAMAIFVMVTLSLVYAALGASFAFRPGTLEVSWAWLTASILFSTASALLGGWVAARVSPHPTGMPVKVLAAVVFTLGLALAMMQISAPEPPAEKVAEMISRIESGDLGNFEAGGVARQPTWYTFLLPVIGAVGVWAGGRKRPSLNA
ncbi:MAG: hypothetical protein K0U98_00905 [Deltaproteobacteria bacterium]|nr:hypothetical protein [Deltaproteobacteria bacterium]